MKKMGRAYSLLEIKSAQVVGDERIIEGIASTPNPDRMGDIVNPMGAKFSLPLALLWQHKHDAPIGFVEFAKTTEKGITFRARIVKIDEPGALKDRSDEAWQSLKSGVVRGVSIGFSAKKYSAMKDGGLNFEEWEWLELSLVTIPANADATISVVRSIDQAIRSAPAAKGVPVVKVEKLAGGSAVDNETTTQPQSIKGATTMTIQEQLQAMRAKRAELASRMSTMISKSAETGETFDEATAEEFDGIDAEVKAIDGHIKRLEQADRLNAGAAQPVQAKAGTSTAAATASYSPRVSTNREEKGQAFGRFARCIAMGKGNLGLAERIAEKHFSEDQRVVNMVKAAVSAGSTTDADWAGSLVGEESAVIADFVDFQRPQTIIGKFGTDGLPSLRNVPFRIRLAASTSGGAGYWVGEGKAKPVTSFSFADSSLLPLKVANIAVLTDELVKYSNPKADLLVRDLLAAALTERLDIDFINPAKAAVAGQSPASVTNGVTPIASSGTTAAAARADFRALMGGYIAANNPPTSGVLVMDSLTALSLSLLRNDLGQAEFPGLTIRGGMFEGVPVIVSDYLPRNSTGGILVMINAQDIYLGDEGGVSVDMSNQASIEMNDAPTQDSIAGTGSSLVSLWQTNSVAVRAERVINWSKRRPSAVAYVSGVNYA